MACVKKGDTDLSIHAHQTGILCWLLRKPAVILAAGWCLVAGVANAEKSLSGRVVAIADGETVTVLDASKTQHRIRIAGIDAPERGQQCAQRSKERLSRLV